jgi:biopolymer transport protein ExbD
LLLSKSDTDVQSVFKLSDNPEIARPLLAKKENTAMKTRTTLCAIFFCLAVTFVAQACGGASESSSAQRKSAAGMTDAPATLAANLNFFKVDGIIPDEEIPLKTIAVDDTSVYCWASPAKGKWAILKVSKEGGEPVQLVASDAYISALTVDDEYLYWLTTEYRSEKSRLLRVSKKGGEPTTLASFQGVAENLLMDQSNLYYFFHFWNPETVGGLAKLKKQGGEPVTLTKTPRVFGTGLDDKRIYWTNTGEETLNWVDKSGGGRIAVPVKGAGQLFIDEQGIYIATDERGLLQLDKNGAEVASLWPSVSSVFCQISGDDESVYFNASMPYGAGDEDYTYNLFKVSKKDGSLAPVMKDEGIFNLAVDGGRLYWTNFQKKVLMKIGKSKLPDADPNVAAGLPAFISIPAEGQVYLGGNKVPVAEIAQGLKTAMKSKPPKEQVVYIKSVESVKYGDLVAALSAAQKAGIKRINLIVAREDGYPLRGMMAVEITDHYSSLVQAPKEISTSNNSSRAEKGRKRRAPEAVAYNYPEKNLLILEMKAGAEDAVELNTKPMSVSELQGFVKDLLEQRLEEDRLVIVKASKTRAYGDVVKIIRALDNAGAKPITLQLELLDD